MGYESMTSEPRVYKEFGDTLSDSRGDYNKVPNIQSDSGALNPQLEKDMEMVVNKSKLRKHRMCPIYDFKTKNKSFIQVHFDLKQLGIKNNKFHLILYDNSLQGIDPFSPLLPLETQVKIMAECIRNPWFFLREIARIPQDGTPVTSGGGVPFALDRNSLACWYLFINNIDFYSSKPRQRGKTQNALAIIDYAFHFSAMSSTITFSNKDATNNKLNLYRLKCQRDLLPAYLQMRIFVDDEGKIIKEGNNVTTMRNPVTANSIQLLPRANSHDSAMTNGRGMTSSIQYYDEFDFMPWNSTILESSAYAYSTARENAIKHNSSAIRIFTSTPGDLDSRDGKNASEFIDHMVKWNDNMFDTPIQELIAKLNDSKSKRNGIMYVEHTWRQLKCTQEWYETQCRLVSYKQETVMREIDLMRIHGSSLSPFNRDDIMYLMSRLKKATEAAVAIADYGKDFGDAVIYMYSHLQRNVPYIIGIDPSESLGGDNNALSIISPYDLSLQGEMKSPYISQKKFCKLICRFMDEYCNNALIVIENNKGRELINYLLETKYRDRIWYDKKKLMEVNEKVRVHGAYSREAYERRAFGFNTNPSSRNLLFGTLETLMHENKNALIGEFLITDIAGLIKTSTGKIEAGPGNHDDNIMSYLLGATVFRIADNLEDFGLYRGMTPHESSMELNATSSINKIRELLPSLPSNMREMFSDVLKAADPNYEYSSYGREVQQAIQKSNQSSEANTSAASQIVSGHRQYEEYADSILALNDDPYDYQSDNNSFDVMNYI